MHLNDDEQIVINRIEKSGKGKLDRLPDRNGMDHVISETFSGEKDERKRDLRSEKFNERAFPL